MGWLQSLFSPLKKFWFRLHSTPKTRRGIYILYEDVKSCPYEDVQVLWSILVESHTPMPSKPTEIMAYPSSTAIQPMPLPK